MTVIVETVNKFVDIDDITEIIIPANKEIISEFSALIKSQRLKLQ